MAFEAGSVKPKLSEFKIKFLYLYGTHVFSLCSRALSKRNSTPQNAPGALCIIKNTSKIGFVHWPFPQFFIYEQPY